MKTVFSSLLILLFIAVSNLKGQDYFIKFEGSGERSNVSRVKIENLNQGTTLTIKGTDLLHLVADVSSMEPTDQFKNNQIIFAPNPTATSSKMQFFLPEDGNTIIELYNYSGRKVAQTQDLLTRGIHTYQVQGLERGMSIVAIKSGRYSSQGKLICTSFANTTPGIIYENTTIVKEQESITMQYNTGDRIKFTAYSGRYSTIVVDVPAESKTIGFDFIACTDADENNYPIVKIGSQFWMAENLRTIRYQNNDLISVVKDNNIWRSMTGPGCTWYNNNVTNMLTYGALYNWKCATDSRNVCPAGWHLPSYEEWAALISFLGDESMAGDKLKETGKAYWSGANSNATNESGFSAIPGGFRNYEGRDTMFFGLGESANWWSSSQTDAENAWYWTSSGHNNTASGHLNNKKAGYSIRCIQGKDQGVCALGTRAISEITTRTAISGGDMTANNSYTVMIRGVCWNTSGNPTIEDSKTSESTGRRNFISILTGLEANTTYYVRAFAVSSTVTAYGDEISFTTNPVMLPDLATTAVSSITAVSALSGGNITDDGGGAITSRGVCWATTPEPTTSENKTMDGDGTGSFTSTLSELQPGTTYHVRSYSINSAGTSYGDDLTFTTAAVVPVVDPATITNITTRTALSEGNITSNGGSPVLVRGICWSALPNPTIANSKTDDGSGSGIFTSTLNNLAANTTYYVRTYAINSIGTAYGDEVSFTSARVVLADLTTATVTSVGSSTAISGGTITNDGGGSITARGVCWATTSNPTTSDSRTTDGTGTGSFTSTISGLQPGTTYHVRSYSTNSAGTAYGNDLVFTSEALVPTVTSATVSEITQRTAVSGGNITSNGGYPVTARGVCWGTGHNPTTAGSRTNNGSGNGSFTSNLTGLIANTTYYVRAYAVNSAGTAYGNEVTFTSAQVVLSELTTTTVTSITSTNAVSGGNITDDGGGSITARGVCWATSSNPTISGNRTTDGTGTGSFTSYISGLQPGTTYHVRAYATNSAGTAYGNERAFTTFGASPPDLINGLVGYWNLDEVSGNAVDQMGAHTGTPYATRSNVSGKIGTAYNFSKASRSYINCGPIPLTINSFSLWAKRTASSTNVCIAGFGSDRLGLWIGSAGNMVLCNNSGAPVATWGRLTDELTFHHLVLVTSVTGGSGKAELYVDGFSQGERICSTAGIANFVIGSTYAGGSFNSAYSFDGTIDEVGLWNRTLTLNEIEDLYSQGMGHAYPFTGVVTNDVNFHLMPDEALLLHSVGNKRVISEETGSTRYLKFSSDNGVSYNSGVMVPSGIFLNKARILENGNIVLFGSNKIYYSDDNLTTIHPCNVLDKNGNAYNCHVPVNDSNPGGYFSFMGGFVEHEGVAVMGNYTSSSFGASPVNVYYTHDGITWKIFYSFGLNPDYRDDGTPDGGSSGILLGDPANSLRARHIHAVNIGEDGNFYVSTGDNDEEIHILRCTYDNNNDTWSVIDLLNEDSSTWQRMRTLGLFERNGFYIWGSDGPGTFSYGGETYECYGIYKCRISDINDPSRHILLQPLSDACYSFVNEGHTIFAGMMEDDHIYISTDYGETWSSYPKTSWMIGNTKGVWYNELYKYFVTDYGYVISSANF